MSQSSANAITLGGIEAKLARARANLNGFDSEWERFLREKPYGLPGKFEPDEGAYVFRVKFLKEPPPMIGVLLGEFVHNLRSALDQLVWQLVLLNGIEPSGTQFPIVSTPQDWATSKVQGWIIGTSSKHRTIIEASQPYYPGREPLEWLGDLSNVDKHRIVHPTGIAVIEPGINPGFRICADDDAGYGGEIMVHHNQVLEDNAKIVSAICQPISPDAKVRMDGEPAMQPAFGQITKRLLRPLLRSGLDRIQRVVVEIIDVFRPDFP